MIKNPMPSGSGGSKSISSAARPQTQHRSPAVPTRTTFAPSPLRFANQPLSSPPHPPASNAASTSRPSGSNVATASRLNHTSQATRPREASGSRVPSHPPSTQRTPNAASKEQVTRKGPTANGPPTSDDLPRPENIQRQPRKSNPAKKTTAAPSGPVRNGSRPDQARRVPTQPLDERAPGMLLYIKCSCSRTNYCFARRLKVASCPRFQIDPLEPHPSHTLKNNQMSIWRTAMTRICHQTTTTTSQRIRGTRVRARYDILINGLTIANAVCLWYV